MGEAVPTQIFNKVAENIKNAISHNLVNTSEINKIIDSYTLSEKKNLIEFISENPLNLTISALGRIAELCNSKRTQNALIVKASKNYQLFFLIICSVQK